MTESAGYDAAQKPPRRVAIVCPMCRETFTLSLTVEPRVSFGWSNTKGFLTANVGISGIEHVCMRPDNGGTA